VDLSRLDAARWSRAGQLLGEILEMRPDERARELARIAADEPDLSASIEAMLRADERGSGVLEAGVAALAADLLARGEDGDDAEDDVPSVDRYRVLKFLGRGGMGSVWLAERTDGHFARPVALKVLKRGLDTDEIRRRFQREREILARMEHPGIARMLDGGVTGDGRPCFAMEYVEGRPITEHADQRRLDLRERLLLFERACEVVSYAQQHLVVHRDLKPSNILVTSDGQLKLLDFGIAKLLADPGDEPPDLTRTGQVLLTPEFAAPEQLRGEPVTMASDVFALGVILYELLSGRRPFPGRAARRLGGASDPEAAPLGEAFGKSRADRGGTPEDTAALAAAAKARRLQPRALRRQLRGELAVLVETALRAEPERRYGSAEALLHDLRRFRLGRPLLARPATVGYRARKYVRRHRVAVGAASAAIVALGIGFVATFWQARVARREAARAAAVTDFLAGLFEAADPDAGAGSDPRARELLARGATRIDTELRGQPELQADLLQLVGKLYDKLGDYDAAVPLLERALSLREQRLPPGHPRVREALVQAGSAHLQAMNLEAADSLLRRALVLLERAGGAAGAERGRLIGTLAVLEGRRGDGVAAESLYRAALEADRRHFGPEHEDVATDLNNLGGLLATEGRLDEALAVHREALAMRRRVLPPGHSEIPYSLANLAFVIDRLGRLGEADSLYRESIAMRRRIYPEGHPILAATLRELGALEVRRQNYDSADTLLREAADMVRRYLGARHPDYALAINERGVLAYRRGDFAAAAGAFALAAGILEAVLPEGHGPITR